jgi:acetylornithine deacetylase/succinyl-diaminopimelate desuccinylase-like protein
MTEYSKLTERKCNVYFLGAVSEESRHLGIRKFIDCYKDVTGEIDLCIMGEPTSLDLGIAHKGSLKFTIKTEGKSAHGSIPQLGINAINMMSEIISSINEKLVPKYDDLADEILGKASLNIGVIKGGRAFNIVPDSCSIELDRRVLPVEKIDEILKSFKDIIDETGRGRKDFKAGIAEVNDYIPFLKTDTSSESFIDFEKSCRKIFSGSMKKGLSYATDGGFTYQNGMQTIVFGPGDVKNCHKLEEYVSRKELLLAHEIFKDYLSGF